MADDFVVHLDEVMTAIAAPYIQSRYLGFVAITAVTVFELAIKEVICEFSFKKHKVLGNLARDKVDRINGRVKLKNLKDEFIKPFGAKYLKRFESKLEEKENASLRNGLGSVKSSYGNIIQWRHDFVHEGRIPGTTNYVEMKSSYKRGQEVIHCLYEAMQR